MKTKIKIVGIVLISLLLSFIPADSKTIISRETLASYSIELFGVTLAIIALLFTVLDRYKEYLAEEKKVILEKRAFPVIKNMGDDVIATLFLITLLFLYDIFYAFIQLIQNLKYVSYINLDRFILLLLLLFLLAITIDISISIVSLINGLININKINSNVDIQPNEKEIQLISVARKLDNKHFEELLSYIKTLAIKQELDK